MIDAYGDRIIYVLLSCAQFEKVDVADCTFVNIEEGPQGEDVVTFTCPRCDETHKSVAFST